MIYYSFVNKMYVEIAKRRIHLIKIIIYAKKNIKLPLQL